MFERIIKRIKYLKHLQSAQKSHSPKLENYLDKEYIIHKKLDINRLKLEDMLGKSNDIIFREFKIGIKSNTDAFICFVDGLVDKNKLTRNITKALMIDAHFTEFNKKNTLKNIITTVKENILSAEDIIVAKSFNDVLSEILSGKVALFIDGSNYALIIEMKGFASRNVEQPSTEAVIRGPREGFTESLQTNASLIRKKVKNLHLTFELFRLGKQTHTDIYICYIDGIASKKIIDEVKNRLSRIEIDSILESGYIEQLIEDNPFSPFASVGNSEKPDIVAAKILEGRVAILCDGTPFVLTVPYLFIESFHSPEDYYSRPYLTTLVRILRLFAFLVTLMTPALYIALATFHQEMIPTVLLITAAAAREGIPFPAFIEAILMGIVFEMLRESGVRMPRPIGQAVSIVGALVIGEAAVQAGIIGAPMVIISAITGISSFIVPSILDGIVLFRLLLILLSAAFGLYGIVIGLFAMLAHLCSLRSFGTPYLAPLAPNIWNELKDTIIRAPLWLMRSRPKSLNWKNSRKQASNLMPNKPNNENRGEDY